MFLRTQIVSLLSNDHNTSSLAAIALGERMVTTNSTDEKSMLQRMYTCVCLLSMLFINFSLFYYRKISMLVGEE